MQFGDFREADQNIRAGLGENYDAQSYSMEVVERLTKINSEVSVICINSKSPHDEFLPSGIRSIGIPNIWRHGNGELKTRLEQLKPSQIVLRFPSVDVLKWGQANHVSVLVTLADSFTIRPGLPGLKDWLEFRRLAALLNKPFVSYVGNHNIAASRSLAQIGVDPRKIIPWDWPRSPTPADFDTKSAPAKGPKKLIYVGTVSEAKGVGDVIRALACDARLRYEATLDVLGGGEIDRMRCLAADLGVADRVRFAGKVSFSEVAPAMHAADIVIVYSRHAYSEGLPGTIYLGLASRTPLVISDHPMFVSYLQDMRDVLIVREQNPEALAAKLNKLLSDQQLYAKLSAASAEAFDRVTYRVYWGEVIERGLRLSSEDDAWFRLNNLATCRA